MRVSLFLLCIALAAKSTAALSASAEVVQNTIPTIEARNLRVVRKTEDDSYDEVDTSDDEGRARLPISSLDDVLSGKVTRRIAKIQQKTGVKDDDEMVGLVSRLVKLNDENKELFQQMRDQGWTLEKVSNALNIPAKEATLSKTALLDDLDYRLYKLYEGAMAKNLGIKAKPSA